MSGKIITYMVSPNDIEHLSNLTLFREITQEEIRVIINRARVRRVNSDEFFFMQGDPAESIFVLREGRVKLTQVSPDGQQTLMRVLGPWNLFAIVGFIGGRTYPVSAQAAEPSSAYVWQRENLMDLVNTLPRLTTNVMQMMAESVQEFQERLREMATERVERRLARTLIRLAGQTGKKTEYGVLLDMHLTRQDLAEMIGATLFTVSRILSQWETSGFVLSGREKVTICNPHALVKIAEDI
jgi:CRP-like cAMP-binding protein